MVRFGRECGGIGIRTTTAVIVVMLLLLLGLGFEPAVMQARADDIPALEIIRMFDKQAGWAVADRTHLGILLRTTNGGTHWMDDTPLNSSGQKISAFLVTAVSSHIAWLIPAGTIGATTSQVLHTVDGGRTWRSVAISVPSLEAVHFINTRDGWAVAKLGSLYGERRGGDLPLDGRRGDLDESGKRNP